MEHRFLEYQIKDEGALASYLINRYRMANAKKCDKVTLIGFDRSKLFTTSKFDFLLLVDFLKARDYVVLRHRNFEDLHIIKKLDETRKVKKIHYIKE